MENNYKITISVLGNEWSEEGKTIHYTLDKFPLTWEQIKSKGVVVVTKGNLKRTQLIPGVTLRRILSNKIMKAVWSKRLKLLLEADKK